jgi:hypothetical protein
MELVDGRYFPHDVGPVPPGGVNERCRGTQGSFPESQIPPLEPGWREKLFESPPPVGWQPHISDMVHLRPGLTIAGKAYTRATVFNARKHDVDLRVQHGRIWRIRYEVRLEDIRPC